MPDRGRKGGADFPPDPWSYTKYLDNLSTHNRAPTWKIKRGSSEASFFQATAAKDYEPGMYRQDCDFVSDRFSQVRGKDVLSGLSSSVATNFKAHQSRTDQDGVLHGIRNPGNVNLWFNPTGPGQYEYSECKDRCTASTPSYTVPSSSRERRGSSSSSTSLIGPGMYEAPSRFDDLRKKREAKEEEQRGNKPMRRPVCRCEGQWGALFRSIKPTEVKLAAGKSPDGKPSAKIKQIVDSKNASPALGTTA